jgi:hypothetical protein
MSDAAAGLLAFLAAFAPACGGGKHVVCPAGQTDCGGVCKDLQADPVNCHSCGLRCATGGVCNAGSCECPPGTVLCGAACVDTATSAAHCGSCTHACGAGTCSGGACTCSAVPSVKDCGAAESPQCRDTAADRANCGACDLACLGNQICTSSACQDCTGTTPDRCGNTCLDLQTDHSNCGSCGKACGAAQTCTAGACTCTPGLTACGTACVDLLTDPFNCGACGKACPEGQTCSGGHCTCTLGLTCGPLCCEGTACCGTGGNSCQTRHDAGIGGAGAVFYDCNPAGSKAAAQGAALLWAPAGHASAQVGVTCSFSTECVAWENAASPTACGVWCYAGFWAGKVEITTIQPVCNCPTAASPAWH